MDNMNKVLERVKKMLALGNDSGATEGERETALRMAYNVLAKHNLTLADLPADDTTEVREQQEVMISVDRWGRSVSSSIAKLFFCTHFYRRTGTAGKEWHCFIGRQSNAITARYMAEHMMKSIKREATRRYCSPTSPEGRSFCVGTADSIRKRVVEMLRNDTESTPGTALVLINLHDREQEANKNWLMLQGIKTRTVTARSNQVNLDAFQSGRDYGKTVSLNQQVGTSQGLKKLK